jgi:flagellar hook-associated protein 3 FlgL
MAVRISTKALHEGIAASIASASQRALKLQMGLADGKAVRTPSDDPVRAHQSMWFRERIRATDQYVRSIDGIGSYLNNLEASLGQVQDAIGDLMSLQTQAADDSTGADGRAALAVKVSESMELLAELGNTRYAGLYIFGGRRTLEAPVVPERDANDTMTGAHFNPQGVGGALKRVVGQDLSLTINVTAADVFGENGALFNQLSQLREALLNNDGDRIRSMGSSLEEASNRVITATTSVGSLISRTDTLKSKLGQEQTSYEDGRSKAEDLDMARTVVDFQAEQTSLQASLSAGSRILNMSLLDYLR